MALTVNGALPALDSVLLCAALRWPVAVSAKAMVALSDSTGRATSGRTPVPLSATVSGAGEPSEARLSVPLSLAAALGV